MAKQKGFETGDLVRLRSGGPVMTVQEFSAVGGGTYKCQWFAGKKLEFGYFAEASLETASTDTAA